MVLSKRERIIALVAIVVVGALVADRFVISPVSGRLQQTESEKQQLLAEVNEALSLFERQRLMERKWKKILSDGLRSEAEAESRVGRALHEWSEDAKLTLTSVKPERTAGDKGVQEITFVVAGRGPLDAVAWFLYQIETAELPVKVTNMRLGSTSESGDNVTLELRLSAIYLSAGPKPAETKSQPSQPEEDDEEQLL